jgi:ribonuclease P protein component
MIHRKHRFHGLHSLGFVMRRGQILYAPGLSLKFIINQRQTAHRVAVVVSRKVSKSAVVRNRIRRRIFEAVRQMEEYITQPFDLVFLVREVDLKELRSKDLTKRVQSLLEKAEAIPAVHPSATTENHAIVLPKEKNT